MNHVRSIFNLDLDHDDHILLYGIDEAKYLKLSDQLLGCWSRHYDLTCSSRNKAFINGLINETQQRIVEAVHIQEAHLKFKNKNNSHLIN